MRHPMTTREPEHPPAEHPSPGSIALRSQGTAFHLSNG